VKAASFFFPPRRGRGRQKSRTGADVRGKRQRAAANEPRSGEPRGRKLAASAAGSGGRAPRKNGAAGFFCLVGCLYLPIFDYMRPLRGCGALPHKKSGEAAFFHALY